MRETMLRQHPIFKWTLAIRVNEHRNEIVYKLKLAFQDYTTDIHDLVYRILASKATMIFLI